MSNSSAAPIAPNDAKPSRPVSERLASLDALRGFDIFLLLSLGIVGAFSAGPMQSVQFFTEHSDFWKEFARQFTHVPWEGFTLCDLLMPLFVFMAGTSIPFSLSRYVGVEQNKNFSLWIRIIRRVLVLWFFGMCVQGNLLSFKPENFKLYSNTLQSIAVGYFFSSLAYLYLPKWGRFVTFIALLVVFWAACTFITIGGCGGGNFDQGTNLAYWIDQKVLGCFMDQASVASDGSVVFPDWYQYTWILSSLTFVATSLSGMFAGELLYGLHQNLKSVGSSDEALAKKSVLQLRAFITLFAMGGVCALLGWFWDMVPKGSFGYCPIIKHIWTPSMVLWSSGLSYLLLAVFYLVYDILRCPVLKNFFTVLGVNAFAAYILSHLLHFDQIAGWLTYGLGECVGSWMATINQIVGFLIIWLILWDWRRIGRFFRA